MKLFKRFFCWHLVWEPTHNPYVAYSYDEYACMKCGKRKWFRFDKHPMFEVDLGNYLTGMRI